MFNPLIAEKVAAQRGIDDREAAARHRLSRHVHAYHEERGTGSDRVTSDRGRRSFALSTVFGLLPS
jgi:hypothetical protein